ncbi:WD40 repeat-like protein [Dentipellis sp. KUC8613]|nr:WD40 repeat-like protein [Dentipellis sp. KUC8613]
MQPRDGVEFGRLHDYQYTAACPALSIHSTAIVLPSHVYADPDHSDEVHPHQIPTFAVSAASPSSSSQILATAHQAGTVSLYALDPSSPKQGPSSTTYSISQKVEIKPFASSRLHKSTPTALLLLPSDASPGASNLLISAGLDFTIHLTPITAPRAPTATPTAPAELTPSASLKAHTRAVTSLLALSPSSLVSGGKDGALRFWDLNTAQQIAVAASSGLSPVTALAGSDSDAYAATQSGVVERFDVRTRASVARTEKSGVAVSALAVDGDAHAVVAGGADGVVRVWDVRALGQERARWKRTGAAVEGAAILPRSGSDASLKVLVGGEDGLPYVARLGEGDRPDVSVETELVYGDVEAVRCVRLLKGVNGEDEVWMSGDGGIVRRYTL